MHQCKECGFVTADMDLIPSEKQRDSMRVFCPRHDMHEARYLDGRPLLDDACPLCVIENLQLLLSEARDIQLSLSQYGISRRSQVNVNRIDVALSRTAQRG
jgi:hypothetical protein